MTNSNLERIPKSPFEARIAHFVRFFRRLMGVPATVIGMVLLCIIVLAAVFAPLIAPYDIYAQNLDFRLQAASWQNLLGTDELGRDILSRIIFGSRITLYIAFLTAVIAGPIGLMVGTISGYVGGLTDKILMRIVDVFLAFPSLILALAFVAALGPSIENAIIAISLSSWAPIARLARAETLSIRNADFILAARLQGSRPWRIVLSDVVPICLPSVMVRLTMNMAAIILTAAGLGFLGVGAQPPSPEWGAMLSTARQYVLTHWWIAAAPGTMILLTSLAFNLLGDGLRDAMDPRNE